MCMFIVNRRKPVDSTREIPFQPWLLSCSGAGTVTGRMGTLATTLEQAAGGRRSIPCRAVTPALRMNYEIWHQWLAATAC